MQNGKMSCVWKARQHALVCAFLCCFLAALLPPNVSAREKADLVVTGGTVVTMDGQRRVIEDGAIAIRGDSIVAVGPRAEIESRFEAAQTIGAHGALVMPGFESAFDLGARADRYN